MPTIQELFNKAYQAGRNVQEKEHNGETIDGRGVWQALEKEIGELKDKNLTKNKKNLKYNESLNELYEKMDVIINKFNMAESEFDPKSNHFFMQLKNLVKTKSDFNIQLNRVMQLGFNAGQLSIFLERGTLSKDRLSSIKKLVEDNDMNNLDTYVSPEVQDIINKKYLKDEMEGGGSNFYYLKYMKYKAKYLLLQNQK